MTTDAVDAIVDYRAESRAGAHVLDVAARSQPDGVLHLELTVCDRGGEVIGEGDLHLPPDALPPAERLLGQVLRGLTTLHTLPREARDPRAYRERDHRDHRDHRGHRDHRDHRDDREHRPRPDGSGRPNARRSWSDDEHERLRDEWEHGEDLEAIAVAHGRTRNAIASRLLKLGIIDADHPESPVHPEALRP
jgi:hypothetical protein